MFWATFNETSHVHQRILSGKSATHHGQSCHRLLGEPPASKLSLRCTFPSVRAAACRHAELGLSKQSFCKKFRRLFA